MKRLVHLPYAYQHCASSTVMPMHHPYKFFGKLLQFNAMQEDIFHDVLLSNRLTSRFWNHLPSEASRRMNKYYRKWKKLNLDAVAQARKVPIQVWHKCF
ncbi:hypothetical protein V8C35DRAFT_226886 [Trichoderma chlorosporum]